MCSQHQTFYSKLQTHKLFSVEAQTSRMKYTTKAIGLILRSRGPPRRNTCPLTVRLHSGRVPIYLILNRVEEGTSEVLGIKKFESITAQIAVQAAWSTEFVRWERCLDVGVGR